MSKLNSKIDGIVYQNDVELMQNSNKKSLDAFIIQAIFGTIFGILTGGVFLSGYLIELGASDQLVSYIGLAPSICGIFIIFAAGTVERQQRKKRFVLVANMVNKGLLVSIIFIPLFIPKAFQIPIIFFLLIIGYTVNGISNLAINSWFVSVVTENIRGRYFAVRQIFCVVISSILPVVLGYIVDATPEKYNAFLILYCTAIVIGVLENIYFAKVIDVETKVIENKLKLREVITIPLKNKQFMSYTIRIGLFYLFLYIGASFSQLYMIKYFKLSYTYINSVAALSAILQVLIFYKFWGRVNDRLGPNFVMITAMWFYAIDMCVWFLMGPTTVKFLLPCGYIMGSIESPGFAIGSFNRRYEIIPEKGRPIYDAFFSGFLGIILLLSPIIGNFMRNMFAKNEWVMNVEYGNFKIVYLISAVGIILVQIYNIYYIKKRDAEDKCLSKGSYIDALNILLNRGEKSK